MTKIITILAILMIGIIMTSGCTQTEETNPNNDQTPSDNLENNPEEGNNAGLNDDEWCPVGSYVTTASGKMSVLGIEEQSIEGKTMDMCCSESEFTGEGFEMKQKICYDKTEEYSLMWQYTQESGDWYLFSETYPQGDKLCMKMFNPDGSILIEACD